MQTASRQNRSGACSLSKGPDSVAHQSSDGSGEVPNSRRICTTREMQVMRWLGPFCEDLHLRLGCLGQDTLAAETQMLQTAFERSDSVGWDGTVDILLSTPGRLVTHLDHTCGFSLRHLRFLVSIQQPSGAWSLSCPLFRFWMRRII